MNQVHPKTAPPVTPVHPTDPVALARLSEFRAEVERVRAQVEPELFFHPSRPKPVILNGTMCRTSLDVVATYTPSFAHCTRREWSRIKTLVRESVRLAMTEAPTTTNKRMKVATAFVLWCLRLDVPLDAELVFTPARVEHYLSTVVVHQSSRSRSQLRSELSAIGRAATTRAGWHPLPAKISNVVGAVAPYTPREVAGYWAAAQAQPSPRRGDVFTTMLAVGLGAGLRLTELLELRTAQLLDHPVHPDLLVLALVDRLVPVRHEHAATLRRLRQERPDARLIAAGDEPVRTYRTVGNLVARLDVPATLPALSWMRLRTTWAVACLSDGVNIAEFATMAGVTPRTVFHLFVDHVPVREADAWMLSAAGLNDPSLTLHPQASVTAKKDA